MKLSHFGALTFDCYGTLIDWESGLITALAPLAERARLAMKPDTVLATFAELESAQQRATPAMPYSELLAAVHGQLAQRWNVPADREADRRFGQSVGDWPAFPDTPDALRYLKRHYKLFILSNVDRDSFSRSLPRLGVEFDGIYTAQDIGSYKPDPRNFAYLIDHLAALGIPRERILHTAQSLFHDHGPANAAALASAWIDRRHASGGLGATAAPVAGVRWDFRFKSLGEMADAHRAGR